MTLEQLRVFVAVAERQHITRAATALHLTQAAVSASIAALERVNDVRLFDRVGRNIALTAAGREFLPEARAVLAGAAGARQALGEIAGLRRGRLDVHASQTIASYFLPAHIVAFRMKYPGIAVELTIGNTDQVARAVREGRAELGFVEGPLATPGLLVKQVAEEAMGIYVPTGHAWAKGRPLTPTDLLASPWVFREEGSGTRDFFLAVLAARGIAPAALKIILTLPSNEAVREAVAAGAGAACLSARVCARACQAGALAQANLDLPPRLFHAVRHPERYASKALSAFLHMMRSGAPTEDRLRPG